MADDLRVGIRRIRLAADGKGFVGELRVARKELDRSAKAAGRRSAGWTARAAPRARRSAASAACRGT